MRTGSSGTVQHALTAEAAGVVKQAVVMAKRRGHAQVTPLHVASAMLSSPGGLFRVACQKSHAHPLQCKALELRFSVALHRLPAAAPSGALFGLPAPDSPAISNALVAAFKRAQAHQRRGSVETQQQPILSVRIELEQLVVSILDDPSVSRVMRDAGFSSTQVKANVEKEVSLELCSQDPDPPRDSKEEQELCNPEPDLVQVPEPAIRSEDVDIVIETMLTCRRRRSLAIVGESISSLESTIKGLMARIDGAHVPDSLKEVKLISIPPLFSFCNLHREEVDQKIGELTCLVTSLLEKGVVLYLGDLKWISDYRVSLDQERGYYCSVEHMIMEIGRLVWGIGEKRRFWMIGIATFQTYMRCRNGCQSSLEAVWGLHPVTIPANSLGLSLASDSEKNGSGQVKNLGLLRTGDEPALLNRLPPWLKDECSRRFSCNTDQECYNKWNSSIDQGTGTLALSSPIPNCHRNPNLPENCNPLSSTPNAISSGDVVMEMEYVQRFKQFNAENLNILCNGLEKKVPWQSENILEIAGTILQCRSGMLRRKEEATAGDVKEDTWLFFLGSDDARAKEKISMELARIVFGSYSSFVPIGSSSFASPSDDDCRRKRGRAEQSCTSYADRLAKEVAANPHRIFFVEDFDQADYQSKLGIKRAMDRGRVRNGSSGEDIGFCDAIVVLCSESLSFGVRDSPRRGRKERNGAAGDGGDEASRCVPLDLNVSFDHKGNDDRTADDFRILESVDRQVVFGTQEL